MNRLLKYIAYLLIFVVSFLIFLYMMFPYDVLKERLISGIERQLGGIEVIAGELEPYWFTGAEIEKLKFNLRDSSGKTYNAMKLDRLRVRVALLSLVIGNPRVSFLVKTGKGEIEGVVTQTDEGLDIDADIDDFDVSAIGYLSSKLGLKLTGKIDGDISVKINKGRIARSSGKVEIDFKNFKLGASEIKLGPMDLPLPAITLTKSKGAGILLEAQRGSLAVKKLLFKDGDLGLNIAGKVFLSNNVANSRFNLKGSFSVSEMLDKELPFFFIVAKEKKPDGSYPLSITGRVSSPVIKVGSFTVPL